MPRIACFLQLAIGAAAIVGYTVSDSAMADVLRYHTHYMATVEAQVEQVAVVGKPVVDTEQWLGHRKPPQESTILLPTHEIHLTIKRVIRSKGWNVSFPAPPLTLVPGDQIIVINPFTDQEPPFRVGNYMRVRIRLVSPEPVFSLSDSRNQWWFYPPGQPEEISPPRFPFAGIELLK